LFLNLLNQPIALFAGDLNNGNIALSFHVLNVIQPISWAMWIFVLLIFIVFLIRKNVTRKQKSLIEPTWGCAYIGSASKTQYTANSFIRPYRKLFKPFLLIFKHKKDVEGIFPGTSHYESHSYDKIEMWLIDSPVRALKSFVGRFTFLQNGRLQFYILYGIAFIVSVICIPVIYKAIIEFIDFLKQL
jgi:hypothetical protein